MKKQKDLNHSILLLTSLLAPLFFLISCSNSDGVSSSANCDNWSEQYLAEANAYSDAATVYTNNPTPANCENYKTAGLNFIDALEGVVDCVPTTNIQDFQNSLNDYRAEVNSLNCN